MSPSHQIVTESCPHSLKMSWTLALPAAGTLILVLALALALPSPSPSPSAPCPRTHGFHPHLILCGSLPRTVLVAHLHCPVDATLIRARQCGLQMLLSPSFSPPTFPTSYFAMSLAPCRGLPTQWSTLHCPRFATHSSRLQKLPFHHAAPLCSTNHCKCGSRCDPLSHWRSSRLALHVAVGVAEVEAAPD